MFIRESAEEGEGGNRKGDREGEGQTGARGSSINACQMTGKHDPLAQSAKLVKSNP